MKYQMGHLKSRLKSLISKYAPPEVMPLIRHYRSRGSTFLAKNVTVASATPEGTVLIIAPHQDDEVIGMGGTLGMHLDSKCHVTVLYMTDGRHLDSRRGLSTSETINIRRKEAMSLGDTYNIKQIFWTVEDGCLTNDGRTIAALTNVLDEVRPTVIYLPSFFDFHYDHFAANGILVKALQGKSSAITVNGYEISEHVPYPNYIVDITLYYKMKEAAMSHYAAPLEDHDYIKVFKARNTLHHAMYINSKIEGYAEAFLSLDSENYQRLFEDYMGALRESGSNLPYHLVR